MSIARQLTQLKIIPTILCAIALALALTRCKTTKPKPTPTPSPTPTLTPTPTPLPTLTPTPTSNPSSTMTLTPRPTWTPGPSPTPFILTDEYPSDEQIAQFLFDRHYPDVWTADLQERQDLAAYLYGGLTQQRADVDGDGQSEILVSDEDIVGWSPYFAILGRTGDTWKEWLYTSTQSRYGSDVRATVEDDHIIVDFLTSGGGTGILNVTWEQRWVQCQQDNCAVVWSADLFNAFKGQYWWKAYRNYDVAQVQQLDAETIQLTTYRFSVKDLPTDEYTIYIQDYETPPDTTRFTIGPDTVEIFSWDGSAYRLESQTQSAPGQTIDREFDLLTRETLALVRKILQEPFRQPSGHFDGEGYQLVNDDFWGMSPLNQKEHTWWEAGREPDAATHTGTQQELGEWIAGLVGAHDHPLCRLTVQRRTPEGFALLGRVELLCTANFTRLAWADVTGDGQDELLLRTIPPDMQAVETGAGLQRLHVYAVGDELQELATLDGALNGPDGAGIRWEDMDGDGVVEVLAGLPLVDLSTRTLPDDLTRRFQVYRWDAASRAFVAGESKDEPGF